MRTAVATSHLRVRPGVPAVLDVEVTNTADVIDGVTATINGLDPAWVSLVTPVVSLFPESTSTLSLRIDLPRNCLAGEYLVSVRVSSIIDADRVSEHEFWLSVDPLSAASMTLRPNLVIGGSEAIFVAEITNEGNVTTELAVSAFDETRDLTVIANPGTVSVPPGESHTVDIEVRGKRPFFGQSVTRVLKVTATGDGIELEAPANFTQKPRIPRGVLTVLILVLIIALWATVFLVVVSALRDKPEATKAPAANFNKKGNTTVDLESVGGSISGIVTAKSTGLPVPLITVEAKRMVPKNGPTSVGSTSTGDDGTYTLESLLPGDYQISFSADGFVTPTPISIPIAVKQESDRGNAVLEGKPGSLSGQIFTPETDPASAGVTVTVRQQIDKLAEGVAPPEPLPPVAVDSTGAFVVPLLVTPARYTITITSPKFKERKLIETVVAGENRVLNTVTLGAAIGKISGTVSGTDGIGLGNVEITARSGDIEKATKTPTTGAVGQFLLDALETPNTYVLTFHLDGYADQTVALDLGPGSTLNYPVTLLGGVGTISGNATDSAGLPLGGASVVIGRGAFSAETSTLTESGPTGQPGTFTVSDLPTPGSYTVTVAAAGYTSQIVRVDLPSAGSAVGVTATLPKSTGIVTGSVTASSAGAVSDVLIALSDGGTPRTTASASSPAGAFRFNDVPPGSYTLTFSKPGFATRVVIVDVVADGIVTRNVDLSVAQ